MERISIIFWRLIFEFEFDLRRSKFRSNFRYSKFDLAFLENPFSVVLQEWVTGGGEVSKLIKLGFLLLTTFIRKNIQCSVLINRMLRCEMWLVIIPGLVSDHCSFPSSRHAFVSSLQNVTSPLLHPSSSAILPHCILYHFSHYIVTIESLSRNIQITILCFIKPEVGDVIMLNGQGCKAGNADL